MRLSIAALWIGAIVLSVLGATMPPPPLPADPSPSMFVLVLLLPLVVFGVGAFWARHSPFYSASVASFVDRWAGEGATARFLVELRPLLLFACGAVVQGGSGLWQAWREDGPPGLWFVSGFFVSGGVAFALSHLILYRRRVIGVYPKSAPRLEGGTPPKPLGEALRAYWWTLGGLPLVPPLALVVEQVGGPFEITAAVFVAAGGLAAWPVTSGRATYSFWVVACVVWILGGGLALALATVLMH